jgi:ZIP family zinc transporter
LRWGATRRHTTASYARRSALRRCGIGIQNFPEGAAISAALRQEGFSGRQVVCLRTLSRHQWSDFRAFNRPRLRFIGPYMPWMLFLCGGRQMYVVVEELIPGAHLGEHSNIGTLGVMAGFLIIDDP